MEPKTSQSLPPGIFRVRINTAKRDLKRIWSRIARDEQNGSGNSYRKKGSIKQMGF
jgi:hypothetical protein